MANKYLLVSIFHIIAQIVEINAQGEQCITPYDVVGVCVIRSQCRSQLDLFYFDFVSFNNDLCNRSERFANGRPFICCTNPIIAPKPFIPLGRNFPSLPLPSPPVLAAQTIEPTYEPNPETTSETATPQVIPETSSETVPQTVLSPNVTIPPTTSEPTTNVSIPNHKSCFDSTGFEGVCCDLTDCPFLNVKFKTKHYILTYDDNIKVYIQQSTSICVAHNQDFVCCPQPKNDTEPTTTPPPPEPSIPFGRLLTTAEGCGYSNITRKKFADGSPAEAGTFPWVAIIGYSNDTGELSWRCGGSMITSRHVLTAAHCITPTLTTVRLGAHDINSPIDGEVQDVKVIQSDRHPEYNERFGANDIAILHLERDIDATPWIRPICVPVNETIRSRAFVGYLPFIAGWDLSEEGANFSSVLKELQVPILDNEECKEQFQRQNRIISDNQFGNEVICTRTYISGHDNCAGDPGGPLMQPIYDRDTRDDRYYQIGVNSREYGCEQTDTLDIYTAVQSFVDWIQEKINQ